VVLLNEDRAIAVHGGHVGDVDVARRARRPNPVGRAPDGGGRTPAIASKMSRRFAASPCTAMSTEDSSGSIDCAGYRLPPTHIGTPLVSQVTTGNSDRSKVAGWGLGILIWSWPPVHPRSERVSSCTRYTQSPSTLVGAVALLVD
jgi:hypothetical protein